MKKEGYHRALKNGGLSYSAINKLLNFMRNKGMVLEKLEKDTLRKLKITGYLGKLELYMSVLRVQFLLRVGPQQFV